MISNERLLEVAREVFLELGIRATTLEVARRAGIAEGTLFTRFKSKEELFRSAMRFDPEEALAFVEALPARAGQGDLREVLVDFAEQFLRRARVAVPVVMMSWSNPDTELCRERGHRQRRVIGAITAFFAAEMRAGRIRSGNAEVLARMLLGSVHQFCMNELFSGEAERTLSAEQFCREVVNVLLAGAPVEGSAGESAGRPRPGRRRA